MIDDNISMEWFADEDGGLTAETEIDFAFSLKAMSILTIAMIPILKCIQML